MEKIITTPDRQCASDAESNNKQLFSIILFIAGLFLIGCTNQAFGLNNPDTTGGSAGIESENIGSGTPGDEFSNDEIREQLADINGENVDRALTLLWDFHGREYDEWDGHKDYYPTRRSQSLDDYLIYGNSLQGNPIPDPIVTPDLCYYTAKRNVNCRASDYVESSLIAILMQGEGAKLLYLNPTFTHGKFELLNDSQCWIALGLMDGPSDPYKMCQVYVVDAPPSRESSNLNESGSPVCSSGLDETSCLAAGGVWGVVSASCNCN